MNSRALTLALLIGALGASAAVRAQGMDATPSPAVSLPASPGLAPSGDIVATLKANSHFTTLVKALAAANLEGVLAGTPDLTLFAPTDEAFAALPPSTLEALLKIDNAPILQKILAYHLIHLNLDSGKIKGAKGPVTTVEGQAVQIDGGGATLLVNTADIIQLDVKSSNGYIQVIDKVLLPPDVTLPAS